MLAFLSKFNNFYGVLALIVFLILSVFILQTRSLKSEVAEMTNQVINLRAELVLCNADKTIARANLDLQNEKIKALEIENIDLKKIKSELQSIKEIATPKLGVCESELTYYKRLFGEFNK